MNTTKLSALGNNVTPPTQYAPQILEAIEIDSPQSPQTQSWVTLHCPEFTSLCPKTAQPDFAKIIIRYLPGNKLVESKSLKLYLFSFRNEGKFHERCIELIGKDLQQLLNPCYLEVVGEFTARGGISIWPFWSCHNGSPFYLELWQTRLRLYSSNPL